MPTSIRRHGGLARGTLFDTNIKATSIDEDIFTDQTLLEAAADGDLILTLDVSETPDVIKYMTRSTMFGGYPSLTGSTNNTVITVTGSDAMAGEANLTFDASTNILQIGASSDIEPRLDLLNDENSAQIGLANAADDMVVGAADGDLVINSVGDHNIIFAQNDTKAITLDTDGDVTFANNIDGGTWLGTTIAVANGGTGATTLNNLITLSTHTTGNYVATVTGGVGIDSTGATTGEGIAHSLTIDLAEVGDVAIADGDSIVFMDATDSNATKKDTLADVATLFAGTGLTAASSVIGVDASQTQITAVGTIATGVWQGTDVGVAYGGTGVSTLLTNAILTGNGSSSIQAETDLLFSSNKLIPTAAAHDAAGTVLTMSAGATTAGTTNNIAGGALTFQGGQGKGSGAGGAIIFQTANAGGSGSSLNALATALTINDDGTLTTVGAIELGHASDTTITRSGSGDVTIEGNAIYRAGGTDVPVGDGGTGASTLLTNAVLTGNGTSAIQAETDLLFSSNKLIPTASAHDAAGTTLTMSAGATTAGTSNNQAGGALTFQGGQGKGSGAGGAIIFQTADGGGSGSSLNSLVTALTINDDLSITTGGTIELGHASDTTIARASSGNITIEGNAVYMAGGTDVAIADGGTGAGTATAGFDALSPMTAEGDVLYGGSSGTVTKLAKGSDDEVLTLASGVPTWAAVSAGAATSLAATSSSANQPLVSIENTHADATAGYIKFIKDPGSGQGADADILGTITFYGTDASNNAPEELARVESYVIEADHGSEAAGMKFYVAENDATMTAGLQILGQATDDGEIDVTIGAGAASTTTIAGTLTMGTTAAMTNAGLVSVANQSGITGLGTVSSGTWEATDVGVAHGGTGVSTLLTNAVLTGNGTSAIQAETTLLFSSNKLIPTAAAHDAAGTVLTMSAGATTAGTSNNQAGGALTFQGGQGKGSGAGGDIIFQTANAAGSGSSLNSLATAVTISDDLSVTLAGTLELGHASDTTLTRSGSGDVTIEGNAIYRAGGTDVPVADGGTGASTLLTNAVLTGNGTSAIQAETTLLFSSNKLIPTATAHDAAGTVLTMSAGATTAGTSNNQAGGALTFQGGQGKGSGAGGAIIFQVANEAGSGSSLNALATALTINDDSTITTAGAIELGHASDTTIARASSGEITIEGNAVYRAGGTDVAVADGGTGQSNLNNLITMGTHTTGNYVATVTAGTGLTSTGATSGESIAHGLSVDAAQTGITSLGTQIANFAVGNGYGVVIGDATQETVSIGDGDTDLVPELQVLGTAAADSSMLLAAFSTTATTAGGPILAFAKGGNATLGSHTIVTDGEELGNIIAYGDNGTDIESAAASIQFEIDGTPSLAGSDATDMPGRIIFNTSTDGTDTLTERLRIGATGLVTFANGFVVGSDAEGDVLYSNGTNYVRLARGSDNQTLMMNGNVPNWETVSASGATVGQAIAFALVF